MPLFPTGNRHKRQPSRLHGDHLLVRRDRELQQRFEGGPGSGARRGPGSQRPRHLHRHLRLGQRRVLSQPAEWSLHPHRSPRLRGGQF